jgi:hypothetical protein
MTAIAMTSTNITSIHGYFEALTLGSTQADIQPLIEKLMGFNSSHWLTLLSGYSPSSAADTTMVNACAPKIEGRTNGNCQVSNSNFDHRQLIQNLSFVYSREFNIVEQEQSFPNLSHLPTETKISHIEQSQF